MHTGAITDVNPFLVKLLGYSHAELLGKTLWEIGAPEDVEASKAAFLELTAKRFVRYENLPLLTKDGLSISVEVVSNVYRVNGDQVIQCNIRDSTTERCGVVGAATQTDPEDGGSWPACRGRGP
jgi:PAS domain S-box-containing protein